MYDYVTYLFGRVYNRSSDGSGPQKDCRKGMVHILRREGRELRRKRDITLRESLHSEISRPSPRRTIQECNMEYTQKFRLYPNKEQAELIQKTFGCCRFVYNHFLARRKEVYETTGKTLNYCACSKELTEMKSELAWLAEVDSVALVQTLRNLDKAYQGSEESSKMRIRVILNSRAKAITGSLIGHKKHCLRIEGSNFRNLAG